MKLPDPEPTPRLSHLNLDPAQYVRGTVLSVVEDKHGRETWAEYRPDENDVVTVPTNADPERTFIVLADMVGSPIVKPWERPVPAAAGEAKKKTASSATA